MADIFQNIGNLAGGAGKFLMGPFERANQATRQSRLGTEAAKQQVNSQKLLAAAQRYQRTGTMEDPNKQEQLTKALDFYHSKQGYTPEELTIAKSMSQGGVSGGMPKGMRTEGGTLDASGNLKTVRFGREELEQDNPAYWLSKQFAKTPQDAQELARRSAEYDAGLIKRPNEDDEISLNTNTPTGKLQEALTYWMKVKNNNFKKGFFGEMGEMLDDDLGTDASRQIDLIQDIMRQKTVAQNQAEDAGKATERTVPSTTTPTPPIESKDRMALDKYIKRYKSKNRSSALTGLSLRKNHPKLSLYLISATKDKTITDEDVLFLLEASEQMKDEVIMEEIKKAGG